jgi:hypothetical protein
MSMGESTRGVIHYPENSAPSAIFGLAWCAQHMSFYPAFDRYLSAVAAGVCPVFWGSTVPLCFCGLQTVLGRLI